MRILFAVYFFSPETGAPARAASEVARRAQQRGHDVEVICSLPSQSGRFFGEAPPPAEVTPDGVTVRRVRRSAGTGTSVAARLWSAARFVLGMSARVIAASRRADLVITSTHPPVLLAALVRWCCALWRTPYVYHCQDFSTEAAEMAGLLHGFRLGLLRRIETRNRRKAAALVVLSQDMAAHLERSGIAPDRIRVINNFFLPNADSLEEPPDPGDEFTVLFAGNMGPLQQLDQVLEAAAAVERAGSAARWVFMGDGAARASLEERAGAMSLRSVEFADFRPAAEAREAARRADLALVSIAPGVESIAFPSKVITSLQDGCRLVAVVAPESELARLVADHDLGVVVPPGNPEALAAAVLGEADRTIDRRGERRRIAAVAESVFGVEAALPAWMDLLDSAGRD
jgi:glycosyltransferase involved in cell wall biosynthesis